MAGDLRIDVIVFFLLLFFLRQNLSFDFKTELNQELAFIFEDGRPFETSVLNVMVCLLLPSP